MIYKYLFFITFLAILVKDVHAISYKREQYARNFYTYGFLVTDEPFNKKSIKLPITSYIDDNYKMFFTSDLSKDHQFTSNAFLICDTEYKLSNFACSTDIVTGPQKNIVYSLNNRVGPPSPIYVLDMNQPQVYLIPENYLLETSKRIELNRYISRLYELELKNQSKTSLVTKSEELSELLHSPLLEIAYLLVLSTFFYISLEEILKNNKVRGLKFLVIELVGFLAFYTNYYFSKKDYFISFKQYLYDSLTPNYLYSLFINHEYNLIFNSMLFLMIIIFNLSVVTVYVTKKMNVDRRNFRPTIIKYIQIGLFVLMFSKNIFISLASGLVFLFSLTISSTKIIRVILIGVMLGLGVKFFSDYYVSKTTHTLFPTNRDYVLLPYTAKTVALSSSPTISYPAGYLFGDGYLLFSPKHKILKSENISAFSNDGNYLIYTTEFNDSILKELSQNTMLKQALSSNDPSPFGYFDINEAKLSTVEVRTKLKCLGTKVVNITLKPYYAVSNGELSTDLNRINLYENFGCEDNQEFTNIVTKLPVSSFISGTNYFRLTADVSNKVFEVSVKVNGKDIKVNYLKNFYESGILATTDDKKSDHITVYSPSIIYPYEFKLELNNNGLNLLGVVEELKNKGMINEEVVFKSERYGEALLYEQ